MPIYACTAVTRAHSIGKTLPINYPSTWLFAHDANFYSLLTGKIIIVDVAADTEEFKGAT
jgi:hypothetical protein